MTDKEKQEKEETKVLQYALQHYQVRLKRTLEFANKNPLKYLGIPYYLKRKIAITAKLLQEISNL